MEPFGRVVTVDLGEVGIFPYFQGTEVRKRIAGGRDMNLKAIQNWTGVRVRMKGDEEDGYFGIILEGRDDEDMQRAFDMAEDLVEIVTKEVYEDFPECRLWAEGLRAATR